jgi:predicted dehydrogenase
MGMSRLRLAVVGVGHLGKEHARILAGMPDVELAGVVDARASQAEAVAQRCGTRAWTHHQPLLDRLDGAVIATPTAHHHAVAVDFLRRGIGLLIEKPLAAELSQADELAALAGQQQALLQVGHIERFNPAFEELQKLPLTPRYISAQRCGGFSGRSTDIGVVLDLMIHDLDLVLTLVQAPLRRVEALGVAVLGGQEDIAQARLTFANGCVADLQASRVHPTALRSMQVWGVEGFAGVDFLRRRLTLLQPAEHLRRPRQPSAAPPGAYLESLRTELFGKHIQMQEHELKACDALTRELEDFVHCLRYQQRPRVDGLAGRDAVAAASQVLDRLRAHPWQGEAGGPCGPWSLPAPQGLLFMPPAREQAA